MVNPISGHAQFWSELGNGQAAGNMARMELAAFLKETVFQADELIYSAPPYEVENYSIQAFSFLDSPCLAAYNPSHSGVVSDLQTDREEGVGRVTQVYRDHWLEAFTEDNH